MIFAQILTDLGTDDLSQMGSLLDRVDEEIDKVMVDGAYDGAPTDQLIAQHRDKIEVVILPRNTAVPGTKSSSPRQRDQHLGMINI
jgi:hypothetical protein